MTIASARADNTCHAANTSALSANANTPTVQRMILTRALTTSRRRVIAFKPARPAGAGSVVIVRSVATEVKVIVGLITFGVIVVHGAQRRPG